MTGFDARARTECLRQVDGGEFDLVIIGGGINGAGVAHDAALRGLKVCLLEMRDFAFGTSSRSSKLIHGGLRYLEHYQFKLVFEGTNERAALRKVAPHLVRPLMFALPVYDGDRHPLWLMDVGLWMYDSLSLFKVEKRHITLRSPKRMLAREPGLNPEGLNGGIIYYDCMTDDARLTLENAMAAAELGHPMITRAKVKRIEPGGKNFATVVAEDQLTGPSFTVKGKAVVNCTGAWTDQVREMAEIEGSVVRPTKGVHLVLPHERLPCKHANALMSPQDGRVFFAIPWKNRTVIGTTDTDYEGDPATPAVSGEDVDYLLRGANERFPGNNLTRDDVISTWVGLRPLIRVDDAESESDVPREHKIYRDGRMVSVAGGKLTTYRRMAAEVVDEATAVADLRCGESTSHVARLPGARGLANRALDRDFDKRSKDLAEGAKLPIEIATRLVDVYGSRADDVAKYAMESRGDAERLSEDSEVIYAEVKYAVTAGQALAVDDVLVRRTSLSLTARDQGLGSAERVADTMASLLGWSSKEAARQVEAYQDAIALTRAFREE